MCTQKMYAQLLQRGVYAVPCATRGLKPTHMTPHTHIHVHTHNHYIVIYCKEVRMAVPYAARGLIPTHMTPHTHIQMHTHDHDIS